MTRTILRRLLLAACSGVAVAPPGFALAEEAAAGAPDTAFTVGEVVVTANLSTRASEHLLTSVDRLGPDVIERQNVDNTWQLFGRLPGVLLTDFNQGTTSGRFSIRGFNGEGEINAVKLLIDGVPSNTNDGAITFVDMVFPLEISSIEVVRGTNDPRYGLDNIAGNASIFTRTGGSYADARLSYGGWNAREAQVVAGYQTDRFTQNYMVARRAADGHREHASLARTSLSGKWGFEPGGGTKLGLTARYYRGEADEPGYLSAADAAATPRRSYEVSRSDGGDREMKQLALQYEGRPSEALHVSTALYANSFDDTRFVRFSAAVAQQERVAHERQWGGLANLRWDAPSGRLHRLSFEAGADAQFQDVDSRRYLTTERVRTRQTRDQGYTLDAGGLYLLATIEPVASVRIIPAWRVDWVDGHFSDRLTGAHAAANRYGAISQPKISVTWTPSETVVLYGNWGRTFQVGVGSGAYKIPPRTADLDPSINDGWEIGAKVTGAKGLQARLAYWRQTASGEVKRKLNDPLGDSENLGRTRRDGVDVQLSYAVTHRLQAWSAATYQRAVIEEPDPAVPLARGRTIDHVPAHLYAAGLDFQATRRLRASVTVNAQDSYFLEQTNRTGRYGAFTLANLDLTYALSRRAELQLQVKNLADARSEYVWWDGAQTLHSPGDPRAVYGAIMLRF